MILFSSNPVTRISKPFTMPRKVKANPVKSVGEVKDIEPLFKDLFHAASNNHVAHFHVYQ